jgi:hypothetical protein
VDELISDAAMTWAGGVVVVEDIVIGAHAAGLIVE